MKFQEALEKLRKNTRKRNFNQTVDLILNLKNFDLKREAVAISFSLPFIYKKSKVCAFVETKANYEFLEKTISKTEIEKISDKDIKKIAKKTDFFIANAKLMPLIAKKFGKIIGSIGKMPDPSLGCIFAQESTEIIKKTYENLQNKIKIKTKELSIKIPVGKEDMKEEEILKNIETAFKAVIEKLPKKEINIRSVLIKFTMGPAIKVEK